MIKSKNVFICIGAIHYDYLVKLKKKITNFRTNPIVQSKEIGGVAYNVSKILSIFEKVKIISLKISNQLKKELNEKNIKIIEINNKISKRHYIALSDNKNNFLLGLANTDDYELNYKFKLPKNINGNFIIFDLNFSKNFLERAIKKFSIHNTIIVCATSLHKVYKIKNILSCIDYLFLNKGEILKLTNQKNIIKALYLINKKNSKMKICTTNNKEDVYLLVNNNIIKAKPPKIKINKENGAGDALAGMMIYLFSKNFPLDKILKISIACGSYHASGKKIINKKDFLEIKKLSKKVLMKK